MELRGRASGKGPSPGFHQAGGWVFAVEREAGSRVGMEGEKKKSVK